MPKAESPSLGLPSSSQRLARVTGWLGLAALLYLYVALFSEALIDDVYINLQYAKTLLENGHWGLYPETTAYTVTSALNILLISALGLIAPSLEEGLLWSATIALLAMAAGLNRLSMALFGDRTLVWTTLPLFLFSPWLLSTLGMEMPLFLAILIWCLVFFDKAAWLALGILLGLLFLARPDGALLFLICGWMVTGHRAKLKLCVGFCGVSLPWLLFAWFKLGTLVPDTLLIKLFDDTWYGWQFWNGLGLYLERYPLITVVSFTPILLLPCAALAHRSRPLVKLLLTFGLGHYLAYSLLDVPPYHWYYLPLLLCLALAGTLGLSEWLQGKKGCGTTSWMILGTLQASYALALLLMFGRADFRPGEMPVHTNWAPPGQYREIGLWLRENLPSSARIELDGELGSLAYFSQRRVLDWFGQRRWLNRYLDYHSREASLPKRWLLALNFHHLERDKSPRHFDYRLDGYETPDSVEHRGTPIRIWKLSSRWTENGLLVLSRTP